METKFETSILRAITNIVDETHDDRKYRAECYARGLIDGLTEAGALNSDQCGRLARLLNNISDFGFFRSTSQAKLPKSQRGRLKMIREILNQQPEKEETK